MTIKIRVKEGEKLVTFEESESTLIKDFIYKVLKQLNLYVTTDTSIYAFIVGIHIINNPKYLESRVDKFLRDGSVVKLKAFKK